MIWEAPTHCLDELAGELRRWIGTGVSQTERGAFCAWRDLATGTLSFEYPEITGYALTYLATRDTLANHEIGSIKRASDWLIARLTSGNLAARDDWDGNSVYNFDLAMIATGLMLAGRCRDDERSTEVGVSLARYLRDQICSNGYLPPLGERHRFVSSRSTWSAGGRVHLLKAVQCLLLARPFNADGVEEAAAALVASAKGLQAADGHFPTHGVPGEISLHPLLYAAEGLWIWGIAQHDADALERAHAVLEWVWKHQLDTGGFPRSVANSGVPCYPIEQSDVTCQAVRLVLCLGKPVSGLVAALQRIGQVTRGDQAGKAVLYQPDSAALHQNTWATLFAAQALELATTQRRAILWGELA